MYKLHCRSSAGQWKIRVGVHSRSANEANHKTYAVSAVINHGSYNANNLRNDIAIMKLSTTVETNAHVSPICITNVVSSDYVGQDCVVTGWGTTSEGRNFVLYTFRHYRTRTTSEGRNVVLFTIRHSRSRRGTITSEGRNFVLFTFMHHRSRKGTITSYFARLSMKLSYQLILKLF